MVEAQQGPRVGALLADRFRVLEVIGRGGMGIVIRAFDTFTKTEVAVKHVRPDLAEDPDYADRLLREAALARELSHRNVCRVHDAYRDGDGVLLSMEYVQGETLRKRLDKGPLSPEEALGVARQICAGVAAAHEKGVVHRDLKPENVLIDESGRAVVLDFGVARKEDSPRDTVTGIALGTPRYMAPEQQQGKAVTPATDVFALGLVIEELYGERRPPAWLRPIIRRATERDPRRRYRDASALGRALSRPWMRASILGVTVGSGVAVMGALALIVNPGLLLGLFRGGIEGGRSLGAPKEPVKNILTRQWGGAQFGTVSPDGKLLAYMEESSNVMEGLLRPLLDSTVLPQRFSGPGQSVTWLSFSPDSRRLAFSTGRHFVDRAAEVYVVDVPSKSGPPASPRRLAAGTMPSWFPDGKQLALSHYNEDTGRWHLARTAVDDGTLTPIEADPPARFELCPTVSPDGRSLAYVAGPQPGGLRVLPASGGPAVTLDVRPTFYDRVQWTPDGKRLLFGTETRGLLSVSVQGKEPLLTVLPPNDIPHNPSLTQNGKALVYTRAQEGYELWASERDGGGASIIRVNIPTDVVAWPLFSPDGQSIALMVGENDGNTIANSVVVLPRGGGVGRQISKTVTTTLWPESFVDGGRSLILGKNVAGGLEVVALADHPAPAIKFGPSEMHAAVSPDGRYIATTRMEGKEGTIAGGLWVRPIGAPPEDAVCWLEDGFGRPTWNPDGTEVAVGTSKGLVALSRGPDQTRRLRIVDPKGTLLRSKFMRYAPDGKLLLADYPHIYEVDLRAEVARPIISPRRISNLFGFTISPDGKHLVYATQPVNSDLWLVESPDQLILAQRASSP